jgi:hypothetical protein
MQNLVEVSGIPVFVGGRVAEEYRDLIDAAGATPLQEDLLATLRTIGGVLPMTRSH